VRSRRASALLAVAVALALAGCGGGGSGSGGSGETAAAADGGELVVDLTDVAGSGQTGTATLTPSGGATMVTVETVSYLVDPQPAAIVDGTCASPGASVHELATIEDGISVTTVDSPLADLRGKAVVVAKSRKQPDVRVACGAIG